MPCIYAVPGLDSATPIFVFEEKFFMKY